MILRGNIDNGGLIVGAVFENSHSTIESRCDEVLAIWCVAEECWSRCICRFVSWMQRETGYRDSRAGLPRSAVAMSAAVLVDGQICECREKVANDASKVRTQPAKSAKSHSYLCVWVAITTCTQQHHQTYVHRIPALAFVSVTGTTIVQCLNNADDISSKQSPPHSRANPPDRHHEQQRAGSIRQRGCSERRWQCHFLRAV